jgi:phospholipid/cholesterol/gamma-HCH transport system ATP-binding protein
LNCEAVRLTGLNLRLGKKHVLNNIDLVFSPGEVVGIIGPGGSGKTQLFKVISTLRRARGTVEVGGTRVRWTQRRTVRQARSQIGLQFQNFALFDYLDVWHNVAFPLQQGRLAEPEEISKAVGAALTAVGLESARQSYPSELSGGMRRRVAIARVMAAQPPVAIFDDPVAGLDPINSAKIMQLLSRFAHDTGALVLIATHDLERLLPVTDRVVAMFGGKVCFDGTTKTLFDAEDKRVLDFVRAAHG